MTCNKGGVQIVVILATFVDVRRQMTRPPWAGGGFASPQNPVPGAS